MAVAPAAATAAAAGSSGSSVAVGMRIWAGIVMTTMIMVWEREVIMFLAMMIIMTLVEEIQDGGVVLGFLAGRCIRVAGR
jgi:hypothetical protein